MTGSLLGGLQLASEAGGSAAHGFANPENVTLVYSTVLVVGVILGVAWLGRQGSGLIPRGWGAIFEHIYDWIDDLAQDMIGKDGRRYVPFSMSLFLFVLASNWSGLLPVPVLGHAAGGGAEASGHAIFDAPSGAFSTTLALAFVSFLAFNFYGLRKNLVPSPPAHGEGGDHGHEHGNPGGARGFLTWLGHFGQPTPMLWRDLDGVLRYALVPLLGVLFVVLNVVEEVARLVSLSIRLYGNIHGEHEVKLNLVGTMQDFLGQAGASFQAGGLGGMVGFVGMGLMACLLWLSSFFVMCIGTLAGFIQAFIFFVLTLSYISHVVADEH